MTGPKLSAPLTDSVDISYWLSGYYPKLLPRDLEPTIRDLFTKLHDIDIYCLCVRLDSVPPEWQRSGVPPISVDALLAKPDSEISPEYRRALEKKRELCAFHRSSLWDSCIANFCHSSHVKTKNDALKPDQVAQAEKQARDFFSELIPIRKAQGAGSVWLFGPDVGPTILDAHTAPFIARMMDEKVGRSSLVPPELQEYAARVMERPEWDAVMHGRPTMYDASIGPVRELDPLW